MSISRKSIFWIHILTGAFLQIRLELSNFDLLILVTGFDLIVPVLTVFALSAGWAKWPTNSFLFAICLVLAGLVTHSAVIYFLSDSVELGTLIKETLKLGTLVFLFASMVVLFSDKNFRLASDQLVTGCLVVFSIPIVLISIFEPFYIARTSQAVGLLSMVFLLSCSKDWLADRHRRLLLCALACGVCLICFLLKSKATAGAAAVFAIWFAMAPLFADRRGSILWTFGLLILAVGSAATLIF
ncbi:MAG: hypothetical protein CMM59_15595, partial [Rhodospirillaceae bacterium]|nr:hypothetical protein [Rhodospirillaceae bacterium]